jgi:hypothetical protein
MKFFFLIYLMLPDALGSGFTQTLTEMSSRNINNNVSGEKSAAGA